MSGGLRTVLPGLVLLALVAGLAVGIGRLVPLLPPLIFAIGLSALLVNAFDLPDLVEPGISKHSLFLETAIILLGAGISLDALVTAGPRLVALVCIVVVGGLALVTLLARVTDLNDRMVSLLAAGSSVCGVSAIAAVAPICDAEETEIAHAAATVLLFDVVTLIVFPIAGGALGLEPQFFGVWIGVSMFSTGPVAAAGFAYSSVAGTWATMTKLARNALIGAVAIWYSFVYSTQTVTSSRASIGRVWTDFPKFLVGFVVLVALTNVDGIPMPVIAHLTTMSDLLFLLAFAGLGFEIQLSKVRSAGAGPVVLVGLYLLSMSVLAFLLVALVI